MTDKELIKFCHFLFNRYGTPPTTKQIKYALEDWRRDGKDKV